MLRFKVSMSLADFVNEHRNKNTGRTYFNVANIGSKVSTSVNGIFKPGNRLSDDTELLTEDACQNGQLPSTRNRFLFHILQFITPSLIILLRIICCISF